MVPRPARSTARRASTAAWLVTLLALVAIFGGLAWGMWQQRQTAGGVASAMVGGGRPRAPRLPVWGLDGNDVTVPTWPVGSSTMPGPVVVNFWASWCGPCRSETPLLVRLAVDYADDHVRFVGVNSQDLAGDARRFVTTYHVKYPNVRATIEDERRWGVDGFPETFIVGRDGRVAVHVDGPVDEAVMRSELDRAVAR